MSTHVKFKTLEDSTVILPIATLIIVDKFKLMASDGRQAWHVGQPIKLSDFITAIEHLDGTPGVYTIPQ
jgi:hypothetical protein